MGTTVDPGFWGGCGTVSGSLPRACLCLLPLRRTGSLRPLSAGERGRLRDDLWAAENRLSCSTKIESCQNQRMSHTRAVSVLIKQPRPSIRDSDSCEQE